METLIEIVKVMIWPLTILIAVLILRKGILELIPNLKKFKYKDLELEFKREAIEIRAKIERDIPKIEPPEEKPREEFVASEPRPMFSIRKLPPSDFILSEWKRIEKSIFSLSERHKIDIGEPESVRSIITKLRKNDIFDSAVESALLELSAYRNKVSHTHSNIFSEDISNTYYESSKTLVTFKSCGLFKN